MNAKQIQAAQILSNRITRAAQFSTREGWLNGPVVFDHNAKYDVGDKVSFHASNLTPERQWFESQICVVAYIGPRGGVTIKHCEGIARALIE